MHAIPQYVARSRAKCEHKAGSLEADAIEVIRRLLDANAEYRAGGAVLVRLLPSD